MTSIEPQSAIYSSHIYSKFTYELSTSHQTPVSHPFVAHMFLIHLPPIATIKQQSAIHLSSNALDSLTIYSQPSNSSQLSTHRTCAYDSLTFYGQHQATVSHPFITHILFIYLPTIASTKP